jgi:hypothetical protein
LPLSFRGFLGFWLSGLMKLRLPRADTPAHDEARRLVVNLLHRNQLIA